MSARPWGELSEQRRLKTTWERIAADTFDYYSGYPELDAGSRVFKALCAEVDELKAECRRLRALVRAGSQGEREEEQWVSECGR